MKIFISWSGSQAKVVAEALRVWLPKVLLNKVDLFVSSQDIAKGKRGLSVIADELEGQDYGLVVLTKANVAAPWVNFEAGALAKSLGKSLVSPLLLDVTEADVVGPLAQFQNTALTDKEDVWKLVSDLNRALDEDLPIESVRLLFDNFWGDIEQTIREALQGSTPSTSRTPQELMEEILDTVRGIARKQGNGHSPALPDGITLDELASPRGERFVRNFLAHKGSLPLSVFATPDSTSSELLSRMIELSLKKERPDDPVSDDR